MLRNNWVILGKVLIVEELVVFEYVCEGGVKNRIEGRVILRVCKVLIFFLFYVVGWLVYLYVYLVGFYFLGMFLDCGIWGIMGIMSCRK